MLMSQTNNSIFFDTLAQYARDSSAGPAILGAVADVLTHALGFLPDAVLCEKTAQTNLRWFSAQPIAIREQIIALAAAVQKWARKNGSKKRIQEMPALAHLEHIEVAVAMYRYLQKRKTAVNHIVSNTKNQTHAAYKAVVRSNLPMIREMRQRKDSRAWTTISRALQAVTGHKIPTTSLSKIVAEIDADVAKYTALANHSARPHIMTRWKGDKIDEEVKAAYKKAGYIIEE